MSTALLFVLVVVALAAAAAGFHAPDPLCVTVTETGGLAFAEYPVIKTSSMIVNPCPKMSREARRLHWWAYYGAAADLEYGDGMTLSWGPKYDCALLDAAVNELAPYKDDYTITVQCASRINKGLWEEYIGLKGNRTTRALSWNHFLFVNETTSEAILVPEKFLGCIDKDESCFMRGECRECTVSTFTTAHFPGESDSNKSEL